MWLKSKKQNRHCLRCNTELDIATPSDQEVTFYQCPQCNSHYTLHKNKSLTDRWGMPISLVLYGVIFEKEPTNTAKAIANDFAKRDDIDLAYLLKNINDELLMPTQKVSEILNFSYPNETALRLFLTAFNEELTKLINK
jgi:DNA-directed RNA polymerase subunit RPC12/RpoP